MLEYRHKVDRPSHRIKGGKIMVKRLSGTYSIEEGVELTLTMNCETDSEFALNWLMIYNNARENKDSFLSCKLLYNSDIVVLTNKDDENAVKEWLERFGEVNSYYVDYRLLDIEANYDVEYDIMEQ